MKKLILLASLVLAIAANKAQADTVMSCAQQPNFGCAGGDTYIGTHDFTGATLTIDSGTIQDATVASKCARFDASGFLVAAGADCGAGSGDVGAVGPGCSTGECLTDDVATSGTTLAIWEGTTADTFEYYIAVPVADPLEDLTWTFPTTTGNLVGTGDTATVTGTMIAVDTISAADIAPGAVGTSEILDNEVSVGDINNAATLGANPAYASGEAWFGTSGLIFEGATADVIEGLLTAADPTSTDKTWTLPDVTGTIVTTGDTGSVTAAMISDTYLTWNETRTGNGDLAAAPKSVDSALAVSNGIVMKRVAACGGVNEYTLASATFTFCDATNNSPALVTYEQ